MAKRLRMTTADYVAIAISPALIMALVGSLVFFLIEVFYAGQHQARLNYAFALFVFAAVLIARISIEMGSERAVLFALPLGIVTFLVMVRYVEQPGPLGHLVNLGLLGVVWWSAHKLTWDCTLIDDDQDASGEGLMQGVGSLFSRRRNDSREVRGRVSLFAAGKACSDFKDVHPPRKKKPDPVRGPTPFAENELLAEVDQRPGGGSWWSRWKGHSKRPHAPGLWVLYFSLAALPLFGLGQHWIPPGRIASRRYVFILLLVYVSAALGLLVTTSFLGLRRYLRQRRVEMPAPMAATWVSIGAALIVVIMFLAALVPRPAAEYAISQVPWQVGSPGDLSPSRNSVGEDGSGQREEARSVHSEDAPSHDAEAAGEERNALEERSGDNGERAVPDDRGSDRGSSSQGRGQSDQPRGETDSSPRDAREQASAEDSRQRARAEGRDDRPQTELQRSDDPSSSGSASGSQPSSPLDVVQHLTSTSLANILKWVVYALLAALVLYLAWTHRNQLVAAFAELLRAIRELLAQLLGGGRSAGDSGESDGQSSRVASRPRSFSDYPDPFTTGRYRQLTPQELVRYTFEAFEAWARDSGHPRTPDQTPYELMRSAVTPQSPMYAAACRMIRLYNEIAYGLGSVSREAAGGLAEVWQMMHREAVNHHPGVWHDSKRPS